MVLRCTIVVVVVVVVVVIVGKTVFVVAFFAVSRRLDRTTPFY